jgi:hypothetical protein
MPTRTSNDPIITRDRGDVRTSVSLTFGLGTRKPVTDKRVTRPSGFFPSLPSVLTSLGNNRQHLSVPLDEQLRSCSDFGSSPTHRSIRPRGAGGRRNQFARDFILSLAGLILFGDRARRAVPPKLFPSSCFGGRCGNTVGWTLASPLGGARPRGPGRVDSPCNIRT